jgi:hypothetical protein
MTHEEQIETMEIENRMLRARCERLMREESERNRRLGQEVRYVHGQYMNLLKAVADNEFALKPQPQIIIVSSEEERQKILNKLGAPNENNT